MDYIARTEHEALLTSFKGLEIPEGYGDYLEFFGIAALEYEENYLKAGTEVIFLFPKGKIEVYKKWEEICHTQTR